MMDTAGGLVQGALLQKGYQLLIKDRASLPMHPALVAGYLGIGAESTQISSSVVDVGGDAAGPLSEDGEIVITDMARANYLVTVARRGLGRSYTDMLRFYDQSGILSDGMGLAVDAAGCYQRTLIRMVCTVGATFTRDVTPGSSNPMTVEKFHEGKNTLVNSGNKVADGGILAFFYPKQWTDIEAQMRGLNTAIGDAVSGSPEAQAIQIAKDIGYQGRYHGVDVFTTTEVPTANSGASSRGCMVAAGGIAWANGLITPSPHGFQEVLDGGRLVIGYQRTEARAIESAFYHMLMGASIGQDVAGVTMTSAR